MFWDLLVELPNWIISAYCQYISISLVFQKPDNSTFSTLSTGHRTQNMSLKARELASMSICMGKGVQCSLPVRQTLKICKILKSL